MTKLEYAESELRWRAKGASLDMSVDEANALVTELDRLRAYVERQRAVLKNTVSAAQHMAYTAEGSEDWDMYSRAMDDANALLREAQNGDEVVK